MSLTTRERAMEAAANRVDRDRANERVELMRRIIAENRQLRADNDVLAIGIGEAMQRLATLEAAVEKLKTATVVGMNDDPYRVDPPADSILPQMRHPRAIAALGDLRERWAS